MSASPLDIDTIQALLEGNTRPDLTPHQRPLQIGPVAYWDTTFKCVSKRCGVSTCLKVKGVPYCPTHALYELNRIWLKDNELDWVIDNCTCNSGRYSYQQCHADDCAIFDRLKAHKEQSDKSSSGNESAASAEGIDA